MQTLKYFAILLLYDRYKEERNKMKMGTSQKQNIAVQHRIRNMTEKPQVMTCLE